MDVNETLSQIRAALAALQPMMRGEAPEEFDELKYTAELYELVTGLDEWLSRGGLLPTDWQRS